MDMKTRATYAHNLATASKNTVVSQRTSTDTLPRRKTDTLTTLVVAQQERVALTAKWELTPAGLRLYWLKK